MMELFGWPLKTLSNILAEYKFASTLMTMSFQALSLLVTPM
jgi:hypothetical protein